MLIPSASLASREAAPSLSRRVNANSQHQSIIALASYKLIKKGEC